MRDDELLGWCTNHLVTLDELAPGLIRRVVMASPLVRQAIFLTLGQWAIIPSKGEAASTREMMAHAAKTLRTGWAKDIVAEQLGSVPEGLLGALERIGPRPLDTPQDYLRLCAFYSDGNKRYVEALAATPEITTRFLWVVQTLDPLLVHTEVLKRVETVAQAHDLNRSVRFLKAVCSKATDAAVMEGLGRMRSPNSLPRLLHRFLRQADQFPAQPTTGDHELRPLTTARALIDAGRAYRNCLGHMIGEALVGQVAFAEFIGLSERAVCEFRPLGGGRGWLLADVHVERNGLVPNDLRKAAEQKCASLGIWHVELPEAGDWRSVRRMLRQADPFAFAA